MAILEEIWKPIPGYEARYEASNFGRIRSVNFWDGRRNVKGRVLRPGSSASGHVSVTLGKHNTKTVHSLVLLAFVGPCPSGHEILHKNHTAWDNVLGNLKYGTRSENLKMDYAVGARTVSPKWINSANGQRKV